MIRSRHLTHSIQTPLHERVYDLHNVSFQHGTLHINTKEHATTQLLRHHLNFKLHSASLASRFPDTEIVNRPFTCDARIQRAAFVKPYHTNN